MAVAVAAATGGGSAAAAPAKRGKGGIRLRLPTGTPIRRRFPRAGITLEGTYNAENLSVMTSTSGAYFSVCAFEDAAAAVAGLKGGSNGWEHIEALVTGEWKSIKEFRVTPPTKRSTAKKDVPESESDSEAECPVDVTPSDVEMEEETVTPPATPTPAAGPFTCNFSEKRALEAAKKGNMAGLIFRQEVAAAKTPREYTYALSKFRIAQAAPDGDVLRGFFGEE